MSSQDNVVYLGAGGGRSAAGRRVLKALRGTMPARLARILGATLDQVDDALFDRAQRAANNADQEHFFVAMRQVRLHRRDIEQRFVAGIDAAFGDALGETASAQARRETKTAEPTLELMDESAVEQDVAVDTAISRSRGRFALPLGQLAARMEEAGAGAADRNPLDPARIVHAFKDATAGLDIDIKPRIILYKLFEKQLLTGLEHVYDEANRRFAEAGVLPGIRGGRSVTPRSSGTAGQWQPPGGGTAAGGDGGAPLPEGGEVYQLLQQLLAGAKQSAGTAEAPPAQSWDAADVASVVSVLSSLQHRGGKGRLDPQRLKVVIGRGLTRSGASGDVGRSADDTIDIVSMLFEVILDDRRLSDAVRALIARLQIPVIKVALLDRDFFGSRRHPARRLINELAQAAAGWSEPEDPKSDPLFRAMADIVERVVGHFTDDIAVFEEALADFMAYREAEQERARHIEERTRQTVEGKARVDEARERVRREVEARTSGEGVPEVARRLLDEAWSKVLFITAVKEGTESENWARQVAIMDRLLKSVRPQPGARARREMISNIPGLLRDIREGLNGIMFNPFEMTRLFRGLEAEHLRCLSEPPADADRAESRRDGPAVTDSDEPETSGEASAPPGEPETGAALSEEDAALASRLAAVDFGTWFELDDSSGQRVRGKLTARLNRGTRFIFVNRAGFKVGDRTLEALIEELKAGRSAILDDNELFDRALESVVANLRQMRAARKD